VTEDWRDDEYLAGRRCAVCRERIVDASIIPTCYGCGWKIAQEFAVRILAEDRAKRERDHQAIADRRVSKRPPQGGWVYYADIGNGLIKIGFTTDLAQRVRGLRLDPSAILVAEPGPPQLERIRHRQFAAARAHSRREDFERTPELLGHIQLLRVEHGSPKLAPDTRKITRRHIDPSGS
jgi:hypothetical protein